MYFVNDEQGIIDSDAVWGTARVYENKELKTDKEIIAYAKKLGYKLLPAKDLHELYAAGYTSQAIKMYQVTHPKIKYYTARKIVSMGA